MKTLEFCCMCVSVCVRERERNSLKDYSGCAPFLHFLLHFSPLMSSEVVLHSLTQGPHHKRPGEIFLLTKWGLWRAVTLHVRLSSVAHLELFYYFYCLSKRNKPSTCKLPFPSYFYCWEKINLECINALDVIHFLWGRMWKQNLSQHIWHCENSAGRLCWPRLGTGNMALRTFTFWQTCGMCSAATAVSGVSQCMCAHLDGTAVSLIYFLNDLQFRVG